MRRQGILILGMITGGTDRPFLTLSKPDQSELNLHPYCFINWHNSALKTCRGLIGGEDVREKRVGVELWKETTDTVLPFELWKEIQSYL